MQNIEFELLIVGENKIRSAQEAFLKGDRYTFGDDCLPDFIGLREIRIIGAKKVTNFHPLAEMGRPALILTLQIV